MLVLVVSVISFDTSHFFQQKMVWHEKTQTFFLTLAVLEIIQSTQLAPAHMGQDQPGNELIIFA